MIQTATHSNGKAKVQLLPGNRTIEVGPGQVAAKVVPLPADAAPQVGVYHWQPVGDGTYRPVARIHDAYLSLPAAAKAFGLDTPDRGGERLLMRLIAARFITGRKVSPGRWQVNLHSLSDHLRAVEADPDFWNEARTRQFSEAL